jgi:thioredoxin-related protein
MVRRTALILLAVVIVLANGCGKERPEKKLTGANQWLSFDKGMVLAEKEKKPVVIDFYTSWCRWCKVMDEKTFSDREVSSYLAEHFVTIRINAESRSERFKFKGNEYTPVQLTRAFGVRGFPSLAYLDGDGELITIVPGFVPKETFLPFLHYIHKGCYKQQMSFEEFLKKQEECE